MTYRILKDRIKLIESYKVPKREFSEKLEALRRLEPSCPVWQRSERSLRLEWASHNLAYLLGYKPERTANVDLDYNQKWFEKIGYFLIGIIALLIIN